MRQGDPRYHLFLKRRQRRLCKKKSRTKRTKRKYSPRKNFRTKQEERESSPTRIKPLEIPETFSLLDNTEETVRFFDELHHLTVSGKKGKTIRLKFGKVKRITVDALMYLVAVIKNMPVSSPYVDGFQGDLPAEIEPRKILEGSGFLSFVTHKGRIIKPDSSRVQISIEHSKTDVATPVKIVDFIGHKINVCFTKLRFLYELLIELETNSYDHAYPQGSQSFRGRNWLAYVEEMDSCFRFTFLDTGVGIYQTIQKNFVEILKGQVFSNDQAACVKGAFNGQFRTQTRERKRGNGLPSVKDKVIDRLMVNLRVISSKAVCHMHDHTTDLTGYNLKIPLRGTLYYWEMRKETLTALANGGFHAEH